MDFGKVAILTGGNSSEREVALATAKSVEKALNELNIDYQIILAENDYIKKLVEEKIDLIFIALHGGQGEDGTVQGLLEAAGIPYSGSGVLASAVCMDKDCSKKIFEYHGIKTPKWQVLNAAAELELELPVVIKPAKGGSTVATTIVSKPDEIKTGYELTYQECIRTSDKVLAEEFIPGREITVGILEGKALPILEIKSKTEFYDYEAKYQPGMSSHNHLTGIDENLYKEIQAAAEKAFNITDCSGMGRVDFRLNETGYYMLEINTLPGMTQTSLLPEAAEIAGIDFNNLVVKILESAKKKG
jgi:D-alanine-D-alanine ligase